MRDRACREDRPSRSVLSANPRIDKAPAYQVVLLPDVPDSLQLDGRHVSEVIAGPPKQIEEVRNRLRHLPEPSIRDDFHHLLRIHPEITIRDLSLGWNCLLPLGSQSRSNRIRGMKSQLYNHCKESRELLPPYGGPEISTSSVSRHGASHPHGSAQPARRPRCDGRRWDAPPPLRQDSRGSTEVGLAFRALQCKRDYLNQPVR